VLAIGTPFGVGQTVTSGIVRPLAAQVVKNGLSFHPVRMPRSIPHFRRRAVMTEGRLIRHQHRDLFACWRLQRHRFFHAFQSRQGSFSPRPYAGGKAFSSALLMSRRELRMRDVRGCRSARLAQGRVDALIVNVTEAGPAANALTAGEIVYRRLTDFRRASGRPPLSPDDGRSRQVGQPDRLSRTSRSRALGALGPGAERRRRDQRTIVATPVPHGPSSKTSFAARLPIELRMPPESNSASSLLT